MRALLVFSLCLSVSSALAEPVPPISIEVPLGVHAGDRTNVGVSIALPAGAADPVLLTTSSEGTALEVVRGRFVRPDAKDPTSPTLRFEVPVVARAPGASIFRVHVLAYVCEKTCRAFEQEAQVSIEIAK